MLKLRLFCLVFFLFFIIFFSVNSAFASTLYLTPSNTNVGKNGNLTVQVRLNTNGDDVNAVSAYLAYPADKLDVLWISYNKSAFSIPAEDSSNGGIIKISRGSIDPVKGDVNVATIGFKSKGKGIANISFINGSAVPRYSDSTDSLEKKVNGRYAMVSKKTQVLGIWDTEKVSNISFFDLLQEYSGLIIFFAIVILLFFFLKRQKKI